MLRRRFMSLICGAVAASPIRARAKQAQTARLHDEKQQLAQQLDESRQENMRLRSMLNEVRAGNPDAVASSETVIPRAHEWCVAAHGIFGPRRLPIVIVISGRNVHVWDISSGKQTAILVGHDDIVQSAVLSRDGLWILTRSKDKTARIWSAASGNEIEVMRGHEGLLTSVAFSPDAWCVVSASMDSTARIWAAALGQITVLRGHEGRVTQASFNPDGSRIATASEDTTVRIWDARIGKEILVLRGHDRYVGCALFSPDGARLVSGSEDCTARIWDARTGQEIATLGHNNLVGSVIAFSSDGSRIVTTDGIWTHGNAAHVWDAATGAKIAVLHHENLVTSAEFSADNSRILTASWDKTARIWDVASGNEIATLRHRKPLSSARFSSDGARILTTSSPWFSPTGSQIIRTGDVIACVWNISPRTVSGEHLVKTISVQKLRRFTRLTREDMQLAGYLDTLAEIDIAQA